MAGRHAETMGGLRALAQMGLEAGRIREARKNRRKYSEETAEQVLREYWTVRDTWGWPRMDTSDAAIYSPRQRD